MAGKIGFILLIVFLFSFSCHAQIFVHYEEENVNCTNADPGTEFTNDKGDQCVCLITNGQADCTQNEKQLTTTTLPTTTTTLRTTFTTTLPTTTTTTTPSTTTTSTTTRTTRPTTTRRTTKRTTTTEETSTAGETAEYEYYDERTCHSGCQREPTSDEEFENSRGDTCWCHTTPKWARCRRERQNDYLASSSS